MFQFKFDSVSDSVGLVSHSRMDGNLEEPLQRAPVTLTVRGGGKGPTRLGWLGPSGLQTATAHFHSIPQYSPVTQSHVSRIKI